MTTGMDWQAQVGRSWAENYRLTDRSFTGLTERLLERISERRGNAVLDVGCGAGELALAVARHRPGAQIVGVDLSDELVAVARERGAQHGNVSFEAGDAARWGKSGFAPELLVSRHGVMFFDNPVAAFANLHAGAAVEAALVFSCFRDPSENPWATELAGLLKLPPMPDPRAPGPFAFADRDHVGGILETAGWRDVGFEAVNFAYIAGKGEDPVEDALGLFRRIGPAAATLRALEGAERIRAEGWIRDWLGEHRSGDLVAFSAAAWIVTAAH
ncbi:MAG: class I SAM-dependent methyltransferase [Novosphingobium sp.]|uniref:class I SAM-dependent methyltransferase n=1 Tax=Novosphingobium sp. TaxID=1874826 RepID=UPI0017F1AC75|nr:class I SAM-dependent methyltransferase [Novosphingobium sp.]